LKGISTGDMGEALAVLLGDQAKELSANVVGRLKADWTTEYSEWTIRDMSGRRYVYWWADGIHTRLRGEEDTPLCLLVIVGVRPDGAKERIALSDGVRESKASWLELLRELKERGLEAGPRLAFYDFPAEHWAPVLTTHPIESTFATVRHRTTRTKNCVARSTFLGLAFKLIQEAEKSWRRIRGHERIAELMQGVVFKDGEPVKEQHHEQQRLAA
jgi:transposase-like protein